MNLQPATPLAVIAGALEAAFRPPVPLPPSQWAGRYFVLPDGESRGEIIDLSTTPHLIEPIDALGPESPDNEIAVMKCAQSGFTTALQILIGHSIDRDPCDMMVVQPTDGALTDFNSQKLGRAIEFSSVLSELVRPQTSRSGTASTTYEKKFPGGSLFLALATSSADLRSKTIKKAWCDEIDEYPADLNEQGDPLDMVEARQISFLRSADWKRAYISTPRIAGMSAIAARYAAGDQRKWFVKCPACGERFVFEFKCLGYNPAPPHEAHYVPECCGTVIEGWRKYSVYLTGEWRPTAPGKYKSYHLDAISAPAVPWEHVAAKCVEAGNNPNKLKTFTNLWLGLPYEVKGDAPDHVRLLERREEYARGRIPARGLLLVAGCDVQHSGIWYEVVAYAKNGESWSIDHGFIEGVTTRHDAGAFLELAKLYERKFPDAFGGEREIEAMAVDAGDGGRASVVYSFCRRRHRAHAVKGVGRPGVPSIGTAIHVDVRQSGRRARFGATLWPVGTWDLKSTFYANLDQDGARAGAERDPDGYCHYHSECDAGFFKQQTAEFLKSTIVRFRTVKVWVETGPNHLLDCRVYAMAMAEKLGLSRLTPEGWQRLMQERGVPAELREPDLFAQPSEKLAAEPPSPDIETPDRAPAPERRASKPRRARGFVSGWRSH